MTCVVLYLLHSKCRVIIGGASSESYRVFFRIATKKATGASAVGFAISTLSEYTSFFAKNEECQLANLYRSKSCSFFLPANSGDTLYMMKTVAV